MLLDLKDFLYICLIEVPNVYLRSQVKEILNPSRGGRARRTSMGFLFLHGSESAQVPGRSETLTATSLDQVNSVLGNRKPRGRVYFSGGLFLSFPLGFLPLFLFHFLSFKNIPL